RKSIVVRALRLRLKVSLFRRWLRKYWRASTDKDMRKGRSHSALIRRHMRRLGRKEIREHKRKGRRLISLALFSFITYNYAKSVVSSTRDRMLAVIETLIWRGLRRFDKRPRSDSTARPLFGEGLANGDMPHKLFGHVVGLIAKLLRLSVARVRNTPTDREVIL